MNIFLVDTDPIIAAQSLCDRHVVKMILETCQLLSTAHRILDGVEYAGKSKAGRSVKRYRLDDEREDRVYAATHVNHPSAVWTRQSVENYNWLVEHMYGLIAEYEHRYNKQHKCKQIAYYLQSPPHNLREYNMTKMPCAMDDKYVISDDPVVNYRNYYNVGKRHLHNWTNREQPEWIGV